MMPVVEDAPTKTIRLLMLERAKQSAMEPVYIYLFVQHVGFKTSADHIYHIGGLPPLSRDEALKVADFANAMLKEREAR